MGISYITRKDFLRLKHDIYLPFLRDIPVYRETYRYTRKKTTVVNGSEWSKQLVTVVSGSKSVNKSFS